MYIAAYEQFAEASLQLAARSGRHFRMVLKYDHSASLVDVKATDDKVVR